MDIFFIIRRMFVYKKKFLLRKKLSPEYIFADADLLNELLYFNERHVIKGALNITMHIGMS